MDVISLIVPCYNEGNRLDDEAFLSLVRSEENLRLVFVNDGSSDATADRLSALHAKEPRLTSVLTLQRNQGKAEAVRQGLRQVIEEGAVFVGYLDADLATPVSEVKRLCRIFRDGDNVVLLAARVSLLGREINRNATRHYLGRAFASIASAILTIKIYDTQCGAKLFRVTPALRAALDEPFLSRWIFDVELLGRLAVGTPGVPGVNISQVVEEPLMAWRDIPGSKLRPGHGVTAAGDLLRIALDLQRRRRLVRGR